MKMESVVDLDWIEEKTEVGAMSQDPSRPVLRPGCGPVPPPPPPPPCGCSCNVKEPFSDIVLK